MNTFMNNLKAATNYGYTENGAVKHLTTGNNVLDMFAEGGAYRNRSDEDCIVLFKKAFQENETLALKCLFYLRDVRGGQGERRFFRVCMKWLANNHTEAARRNLEYISEYGRWDDLYVFVNTPLEKETFKLIQHQLEKDINDVMSGNDKIGISLLAKWLKSENASSTETKKLAKKTREYFGISARAYRRTLSKLREHIKVLEKLMSENRWDEIDFSKIPSKAGIKYRNAFARRDMIAEKYKAFAKDKDTAVNAKTLYPYEIAERAFNCRNKVEDPERLMLNKYWENLPDYYNGRKENGIAVVDVSGSMYGRPLAAAVSLGAYIAERGHGPFANHFITFSGRPQLVEFEGVDIVDKFNRCVRADWGMNTNIEAVFNLLLTTALNQRTKPEDIPNRIYIFSDMEFDDCCSIGSKSYDRWSTGHLIRNESEMNTLLEQIRQKWATYGYTLPSVIFWNLDARNNNIPAIGDGFSYVSGFSPVMVEQILSGKDGIDLMLEKLNSERYAVIK